MLRHWNINQGSAAHPARTAAATSLDSKQVFNISDSPHEFLHDFLHPHLQAYEADAIAPPQAEQVKQVPICLLQNYLLSIEHSCLTSHAAAIL